MDIKKYFKEITEKIENMSDAEFIKILKEVGLDECPTKDNRKGGDTLG